MRIKAEHPLSYADAFAASLALDREATLRHSFRNSRAWASACRGSRSSLARTHVTLQQWNKYFHDHMEEVATGQVQVLDVPPEKTEEIAEAASQTDGIIFHALAGGRRVPV